MGVEPRNCLLPRDGNLRRMKELRPGPDGCKKEGVRRALIILVVLVVSASSCGKPEWAVPRSGEAACMCNIICACGMSQSEDSQKERARCSDACSCDACPGEARPTSTSEASSPPP